MKKLHVILLLLAAAGEAALAAPVLQRSHDRMEVAMNLDLAGLNVGSNEARLLTPVLVNGSDSVVLHSVGVYGRRRYIYFMRNGGTPISGAGEQVVMTDGKASTLLYTETLPYQAWMDGAELRLDSRTYGCCNKESARRSEVLDNYEEFHPVLFFIRPTDVPAEKTRTLTGSAFIDFPVNKTVIYPDYRNNVAELAKINATIDSVRVDADVTIREVWLKGFASPESPYSHNSMLANGRVNALKEYLQKIYRFAPGVIVCEFEPEDWAGLRRFVEGSNLEHRAEILALIDSPMDPDKRELAIKKAYPEEYKFMLTNWYPALRHTDYRIDYLIRSYKDPREIARIMRRTPQNLSLDEFFLLSNSLEPGSPEFTEVWETAVRMYPDDATANYNAAVAALQRGDLTTAAIFLERAGTSPQAAYARGVYHALRQEYAEAIAALQQASDAGVENAPEALAKIRRLAARQHR